VSAAACSIDTPLGNCWNGSRLFAVIAFEKSAYWKMNSFRRDPPRTQLWLALIELNVFALTPQLLTTACGPAPYGCEFVLRPYRTVRYCAGVRFVVPFAVTRFSRIGVVKMPSWSGKRPSVSTVCFVSSCVRSNAPKKCARLRTIGPPNDPPYCQRR
jgi:hypothetical protein